MSGFCVEDRMSATTCCFLLGQTKAMRLHEEKIHELALIVASHQAVTVFSSPEFLELSESCVIKLLQRNDINATELQIYQAAKRWVSENKLSSGINLQAAFAGIIDSVRFPLMSPSELADGPDKDNVMPPDEVLALYRYHHLTSSKPAVRFSSQPRQPHTRQFSVRIILDVFAKETADGDCIFAGCVELQVMPEMAPDCIRLFCELLDRGLDCDITYGRSHFEPNGRGAVRTSHCLVMPPENDRLNPDSFWVSMVRGRDSVDGSVFIKTLRIEHPTCKVAGLDEGTVCGKLVAGHDLLNGLDAILFPLTDICLREESNKLDAEGIVRIVTLASVRHSGHWDE